jgi:protein arginine kinase activator
VKCHVCGEREATVHYIEIIEGKKTSQWLCQECADREGITPHGITPLAHGGLDAFLGEMLKVAPGERERARATGGPTCPSCGYEFRRLQETGLLGCPECYRAFHRQLLPMLRRYHGDTTHVGKLPRAHGPQAALRRDIAQLKLLLEQAVTMEGYEEAARLRDEIRSREQQFSQLAREPADSAPGNDPGGVVDRPADRPAGAAPDGAGGSSGPGAGGGPGADAPGTGGEGGG